MWFKRKPKNRRFERDHVLDVKLSAQQVRATRVRWASLAFGISFGTLFLLFLIWKTGNWAMDRLVYQNPAYALQVIDIQTDGVISADQLRRWASINPGENLLALDLAGVKRSLESIPMIDSVSVERVLPRTLRVRVTEREAVAQILQPGGLNSQRPVLYTLDAAGHVMLALKPGQRSTPAPTNEILPGVTGMGLVDLRLGRPVESPQVRAALRLITEFDRSPMAGLVDLRWIDLSAPEVLIVTTGQGSKVTFAMEHLDQQLLRWRKAYEWAFSQGKAVATLDLSVRNNIPANWVAAGAQPPLPPKPAKAVKNPSPRKKNV